MTAKPPSLVDRFRQLWDPATLAARVDPYRGQPGLRAFAMRQLEIFILTARSLRDEEITRRAAALTYYTLLAIVPLLAVGFALFKAFGGLQRLEGPLKELIVNSLAAGRAEEVGSWLDRFIENINAGAIAGFGVIVLFYSATGLLTNIERSFNRIWGIKRERPLHMRFAIYWLVITFAPPLLGLSISASARLQSSAFATTVLEWLPWGIGRFVISLSSALAVSVAFILSYIIVPNTKVRFRCALLGGIVAGMLWNMSKALFIWFTAGSVKYSAVYGALGALPLLMLWLYLSWIIVLFGVTYTFANQTVVTGSFEAMPALSQTYRERLAARLMLEVSRTFQDGGGPTAEALAERAGASAAVVRTLLSVLVDTGQLAESGSGEDTRYLPARDLQSTNLAQVIAALRQADGVALGIGEDEAQQYLDGLLGRADQASGEVLSKVDLRELARRVEPLPALEGQPAEVTS